MNQGKSRPLRFTMRRARAGFAFALDAAASAPEVEAEDEPPAQSLLDLAEAEEKQASFAVGVCAEPGVALRLPLTPELRSLLEDTASQNGRMIKVSAASV